ncbi:hypothetical protein [Peptoniphilus sp. BV3AC2]|nr:hypothetical protein [Peptoniphilus sp. BV3AC2]
MKLAQESGKSRAILYTKLSVSNNSKTNWHQ